MTILVLWLAAVSVAFQSGERQPRCPSFKRMALKGVADEEALLSASGFPIKSEALISLAQDVLDTGIGAKDNGNCLDDNFEFVAAYVGPLGKDTYLEAISSFKLEEAFDFVSNYHLFRVDPFQPNRVWFHTRTHATHTGTFMGKEATGQTLDFPPECMHFDFTDEGKVKEFGFYVVDRCQGNTGGPVPAPPPFFCRLFISFFRSTSNTNATSYTGLGGAFGFMYGIGRPLPFPECRPYKPSLPYRIFSIIGRLKRRLTGPPPKTA